MLEILKNRKSKSTTGRALKWLGALLFLSHATIDTADAASLSVSVPYKSEINVISSDGKSWDRIRKEKVPLWINFQASSDASFGAVHLGPCLESCWSEKPGFWFPFLGYVNLNGSGAFHGNLSFDTSLIPVSTNGIAILNYGDRILRRCNEKLQPRGATKGHSFSEEFTFEATDGDKNASDSVSIKVNCLPYKQELDPIVGFDHGDMVVQSVSLTLTTFQGVTHAVSPGVSCPIVRLRARFKTNQKGLVHFQVREHLKGDVVNDTPLVIQAKHQNDGTYLGEFQHNYRFNQSQFAQYLVRATNNGQTVSSGWKGIHIYCDSGASNDLSGGGNTLPDPVDELPKARYAGSLSIGSAPTPKPNQCPRLGGLTAKVTSNKNLDVKYKIDCSNPDKSWTGTMKMVPDGQDGFHGATARQFWISKTGPVTCALKRVHNNTAQVIAFRQEHFTCVKKNVDTVDDVTVNPYPIPTSSGSDTDAKPDPVIDPVVATCLNGRLIRGNCKCRRNHSLIRVGPRNYRCIDVGTPPPNDSAGKPGNGTSIADWRIMCIDGVVKNRKCGCPRTHRRKKLAKNKYRCVRAVPPAVNDSTKPSGSGVTMVDTRIMCLAGKIRKRKCSCPRTHRREKLAKNKYRCVKKAGVNTTKTLSKPPKRRGNSNSLGAIKGIQKLSKPPKRRKTSKKRGQTQAVSVRRR